MALLDTNSDMLHDVACAEKESQNYFELFWEAKRLKRYE
jgi:hypothetical protein